MEEAGIHQRVLWLGCGLDHRGAAFRFPVRLRYWIILRNDRTDTEVHYFSSTVDTGAISSQVKRVEPEVGHLPPSSAEINNVWSCTSTPHTSSLDGAWLSADRTLPLSYLSYVDMKEISPKRKMETVTSIHYRQGKDFSLLHSGQTGSGVHPVLYPNRYRGLFPPVKGEAARAWNWALISI
jgi:hypothetical protein